MKSHKSFAYILAAIIAVSAAHAIDAKTPFVDSLRLWADSQAAPRQFEAGATYKLCFVPDGNSCQTLIVSAIEQTRTRLRVQAYSFTSSPVAAAIKRAKDRGVDVKVILDKSQVSQRYSSATFLRNAGIDVVIDSKPAIAHNKVMIFDDSAVFTGSFNFTKSAQERNAENGILIRGDRELAKLYTANWNERYAVSERY
ncbi:phospholipase D family nuclease [Trinickia mobilis]|uniref:phospholipase D family nuclease n=1 Tax=Trinickia mobilis TaxID=2816356 RepID=UPI001A8EE574|nr:phospholipase D family protein [Trinickia mobilis]